MIDTRLITFITLMEEKSYTNAAKKLYITQPAVTHHIKSLEHEYEVTLFENNKTFELTPAGKILLDYAKNVRIEAERLKNNLTKKDNNSLSIGVTAMVSDVLINTNFFVALKELNVIYDLYILSSDEIERKIKSGEIDFGIIDSSFDSLVFNSAVIHTSRIVLVGKNSDIKRMTHEQINSSHLVISAPSSGLNKATIQAVRNKNLRIKKNMIHYASTTSLASEIIKTNDYVAFLYEDAINNELASGVLKKYEFLNFDVSQNFYAIYNRYSYLDNLINELLNKLKELE